MASQAKTYGPYTPVRQAGNVFFVSGQIGMDTATKTAPEDISAQTDQALHNMKAVLKNAGLNMDDVVKTTVFLTDMGNFAAVNAVYEKHFEAPRPARSAVAVRELPRVAGSTQLLVEIEAIAYKERL
jgi:2-iminobutanoate/2-iminopropanoate deaminase